MKFQNPPIWEGFSFVQIVLGFTDAAFQNPPIWEGFSLCKEGYMNWSSMVLDPNHIVGV